jgi:nucleoside phosphorylase
MTMLLKCMDLLVKAEVYQAPGERPSGLIAPPVKKHRTRLHAPQGWKRWLVLAAWPPELTELRRRLPRSPLCQVIARAVGVGLVEAAIGATAAIAEEKPDAVIFVGTAGSYPGRRPDLAQAGVVAARRLALWADSVAAGDAYLPPALPTEQETTPALRRLAVSAGLLIADVACSLSITSRAALSRRIARTADCDVENLEAFAVARAAAGLPFLAILGISNAVGPSAHAQWKRNAAPAAAAACRAALQVIELQPRR